MSHFYTVKSLAEMLLVSERAVYRLVESGQLTAYKVGRSLRFSEEKVKEFLDSVATDRDTDNARDR